MSIVSLTNKTLWGILLILLLLFSTESYYNRNFLAQSLPAEAVVVSVEEAGILHGSKLRLTTEYQTVIDIDVNTVRSVQVGDAVPVVYNRLIPAQLKVNYVYELWFKSLLYLLLILIVAIVMFLFRTCCNWRTKKLKKLRSEGDRIYTQFKSVEAVLNATKDGKHPYQIISTWLDQKTNKTYSFKSQYLWDNPVDYIMDQIITVMIDKKNKKEYLMDLDFLPDNIKREN